VNHDIPKIIIKIMVVSRYQPIAHVIRRLTFCGDFFMSAPSFIIRSY